VNFSSPREALERGIATVYQDLAVVPLMPVWRNFFLGNEKRKGPRMDIAFMRKTCKEQLSHELESAGGEAANVAALLEEEAEELGTASHGPGGTPNESRTGNPPA
jgi:ABC-type sugar transport system ATPase subunit